MTYQYDTTTTFAIGFIDGICMLADILQAFNHYIKNLTLDLVRLFVLSHIFLRKSSKCSSYLLCYNSFVNQIYFIGLHCMIQLICKLKKVLTSANLTHIIEFYS